jgi:hypothetical protein
LIGYTNKPRKKIRFLTIMPEGVEAYFDQQWWRRIPPVANDSVRDNLKGYHHFYGGVHPRQGAKMTRFGTNVVF